MFFKAIEMQGFKSFADRLRLEFTPGVTAIVGPNGSGKSNISDAIRWVMGETSAKTLRGSKMEDVIFAGTQKRSPLGFAEVTIIIDNSDRALDIDFSEVSITRKVYRSGESEYYINKSPCRLKDIHELLMDTGLGRDGYSIVGQGKIDDILSAKSEDRRGVFDEAAGITKYRYRKEEAERKLEATGDNLSRVNDIIAEIEDRLGPLEAQSQKAKKFLSLREELKTLEVNVWLDGVDRLKSQLSEAESACKDAGERLQSAKEAALQAEKNLQSLKEELREKDSMADALKASMFSAKNDITRLEGEIGLLQSRRADNDNNRRRLEAERASSYERASLLEEQLKNGISERSRLEAALNQARGELDALVEREREISAELEKKNAENRSKRDEIELKRRELAGVQAKKESAQQYLEGLKAREAMLSQALEQSKGKLAEAAGVLKEAEKQLAESREGAHGQGALEERVKALEAEAAQIKKSLDAIKSRAESAKNKRRILQELETEFEGYPKSVKAVMNEHRYGVLKGRRIYGPLSRMLNVKNEYITAIESALGAAMQNIVTETEGDAKAAIEFLKSGGRGRATFLPISSVKGRLLEENGVRDCKGYVGLAHELVNYEPKFDGIVKNLLGRTAVADNLDNAIAMARRFSYRFRIVTLQGEVLSAGGSITGGSVGSHSGSLSRAGEVARLTQEIAELDSQAAEMEKRLARSASALESARAEYIESRNRIFKLQAEAETARMAVRQLQDGIQNTQKELDGVRLQIGQAEDALAEMGGYIAQLEEYISNAGKNLYDSGGAFAGLQGDLEDIRRRIFDARVGLASIEKDIEVVAQSAQRIESEMAAHRAKAEECAEQLSALEARSAGMAEEIEQKKAECQRLAAQAAGYQEQIDAVIKEKAGLEGAASALEERYRTLNEEMFALQGEFGRIEAKKAKLQSELDSLYARLWDEYELTYSAALAHKKDIGSIAKAQRRINELRSEIRALGSVNVDAIEEYKNVSERYKFLTGQRDDLIQAKKGLQKLIGEMTEVMEKQFVENFALLNNKFGETFKKLFGGGRAELRLSNPDDILNSGIEIDVQPPGKKLQSISLLSGGEKAFTAIALLFAILKVRPVFFCIFDEIEAALDDENVYKFADYIKENAQYTQFILITHRKGTMEAANTLYGVTMQEKGVSKLLELKLDDITA